MSVHLFLNPKNEKPEAKANSSYVCALVESSCVESSCFLSDHFALTCSALCLNLRNVPREFGYIPTQRT